MSASYFFGESIFSAGGVLMDTINRKVLLLYKVAVNEWLLPKGHTEINETIEQTAQREIYEETGYKNTIKRLLSVQVRSDIVDQSKNKVIFWFFSELAESTKSENTQMSDENFTSKWVGLDEAVNLLKWDDDKKLIAKAFDQLL